MKVDIVLVTWNGEKFLPYVLSSLAQQTYKDKEVHILDNGSKDNSLSLIRNWLGSHSGTLRESATNLGFAIGYNELIRSLTGNYVLVLNQDVILDNNYVQKLVEYLESKHICGSVSGLLRRMNFKDTQLILSDIIDSAGLNIYTSHRVVERNRGLKADIVNKTIDNVFGVPATAAMFRRQALEATAINRFNKIEYFDETFFAYKEDVDLAYRLQLCGWDSAVVNDVCAYHYRSVRGQESEMTGFGNIKTIKNRKTHSRAVKKFSYRNHLLFLFSSFAFSAFSKEWFYTIFYEFGKFFVLLVIQPYVLVVWFDVFKKSKMLKLKKKQITGMNIDARRIKSWLL